MTLHIFYVCANTLISWSSHDQYIHNLSFSSYVASTCTAQEHLHTIAFQQMDKIAAQVCCSSQFSCFSVMNTWIWIIVIMRPTFKNVLLIEWVRKPKKFKYFLFTFRYVTDAMMWILEKEKNTNFSFLLVSYDMSKKLFTHCLVAFLNGSISMLHHSTDHNLFYYDEILHIVALVWVMLNNLGVFHTALWHVALRSMSCARYPVFLSVFLVCFCL